MTEIDFTDTDTTRTWRQEHAEPLALRCPYCGSTVDFSVTGLRVAVILDCDRMECGAQWDGGGRPTRTPAQFQNNCDSLRSLFEQHRG